MPAPLYPPSAPQTVAQVLDSTFRIFQASVVKCLPHGILSMLAWLLPNIYYRAHERPLFEGGRIEPMVLTLYGLGTLVGLFISSAMLLRQRSIASHLLANVNAEGAAAARRMPAIVGLLIAWVVLCAACIVVLLFPSLYLFRDWRMHALFLLPLVYPLVRLSLCWPVLLIEGCGPLRAIARSLHLTRHNWWRSFAVLGVELIFVLVFYLVGSLLMVAILQIGGANDFAMLLASIVIVPVVLGAVVTPLLGAALLVLHADLRLRREGTDLATRLAGATPG